MVNVTAVKIFVGIVLVSMVAIGLSGFMSEMVENYEPYGTNQITPNETSTYAAYNVLSGLTNFSSSLSNIVEVQGNLPNALQYFIIVPKAIWEGTKMLFQLPAYIVNIASVTITATQLPEWVLTGITAIITFMIVMLVLSAIIKWRM